MSFQPTVHLRSPLTPAMTQRGAEPRFYATRFPADAPGAGGKGPHQGLPGTRCGEVMDPRPIGWVSRTSRRTWPSQGFVVLDGYKKG